MGGSSPLNPPGCYAYVLATQWFIWQCTAPACFSTFYWSTIIPTRYRWKFLCILYYSSVDTRMILSLNLPFLALTKANLLALKLSPYNNVLYSQICSLFAGTCFATQNSILTPLCMFLVCRVFNCWCVKYHAYIWEWCGPTVVVVVM